MDDDSRHTVSRRRVLLGSAALGTAALAGCTGDEGDGGEPDDHDDDDSEAHDDDTGHDDDPDDHDHEDGSADDDAVSTFELTDGDEVLAWVHGDHWDGGLPSIEEGHSITVHANVEDEDGHEYHLGEGEEYAVAAEVVDGAAEDVVSVHSHGDHVDIGGESAGITELEFSLQHDGHADFTSPPLTVQVVEDDHEDDDHGHGEVEEFEIVDRDADEVVATYHDDHWDGELPDVEEGSHLSLGANVFDDHGDEFHLGSDEEYELRAAVADSAADIVSFDYHGDHLHVIGEDTGHTDLVFQLWHDDHADYETGPIHLDVIDG